MAWNLKYKDLKFSVKVVPSAACISIKLSLGFVSSHRKLPKGPLKCFYYQAASSEVLTSCLPQIIRNHWYDKSQSDIIIRFNCIAAGSGQSERRTLRRLCCLLLTRVFRALACEMYILCFEIRWGLIPSYES